MNMNINNDTITFETTGKEIYANCGIVGISPSGSLSEGYDGGVDVESLTIEEKIELADYMISLWTKFKQ